MVSPICFSCAPALRSAVLVLALLVSGTAFAGASSIDTSFNPGGAQPGWRRSFVANGGTLDERIIAAARAPDGGYVLAGQRAGGGAGALIFLAKFRPDGSYDTSFGGTVATGNAGVGRVLKDGYLSTLADMTIDTQGRIIVVGKTPGALGQGDFGIVRFNANGTDDSSFDGDGGTTVAFDNDAANNRVNDVPGSVTTLPDGSIFVAGVIETRSAGVPITAVGIVKLKPDGTPDTSFSNSGNGTSQYCRVQCSNVLSVARIVYDAPRNQLLIGGDHAAGSNNSDWFIVVQTLSPPTFYSQMSYGIDLGGGSGYQLAYMKDMAVQTDGKPVALGWANNDALKSVPVLLRRKAEEQGEDTNFGNTPGRGLMVLPNTDMVYDGLAIDTLGRMLLVGEYMLDQVAIATRLNPNGSIDTGFNGTHSPTGYIAQTASAQAAWTTMFKRAFFDAGRAVIAGEAPDSSSSTSDYDLLVTRLQGDSLLFKDGFE